MEGTASLSDEVSFSLSFAKFLKRNFIFVSIEDYLGQNRDFSEFQKNKLIKRAVERELEIIGEAINRILKIDPDIKISEARRIVDLRNWVIHGYDKVDDVIIWGIISRNIPQLKTQVKRLLEQ